MSKEANMDRQGSESPSRKDKVFVPLFKTTEWTVVLAAGPDDPSSFQALESLCQNYYEALLAYLRYCGMGDDEAKEQLHGFLQYFLEKKVYQEATPERGRFRCFILRTLKHYLGHEHEKSMALKRGGGELRESMDGGERQAILDQCIDHNSPDQMFDRRWALTTIEIATEQLRQECEKSGRQFLFQAFKARLGSGHDANISYAELAAALGKSEETLRVDAYRLRHRFHQLLYQTVKNTLLPGVSVEDEMEQLIGCLRRT